MVVGFTTTYAISAYHHWCCQWLAIGQWFSPGPPVSFINKSDCHNITEILLKVVLTRLNKQTNKQTYYSDIFDIWST
jgi:hypothetical protein